MQECIYYQEGLRLKTLLSQVPLILVCDTYNISKRRSLPQTGNVTTFDKLLLTISNEPI